MARSRGLASIGRFGRRGRVDPPVAARSAGRPWQRASRRGPQARPPGHDLDAGEGRQPAETGRRRRVARRASCRRRRSRGSNGRPTRRPRAARARRAYSAARSLPRPTSRALCVSTQSTLVAQRLQPLVAQERATKSVERMRDAHQRALLARRGDRLRRPTGRAGSPRSRNTQIRSPSRGLDLLADRSRSIRPAPARGPPAPHRSDRGP